MEIKCSKCNYEWITRSNKIYITCPNCQRKFERGDEEHGSIQKEKKARRVQKS